MLHDNNALLVQCFEYADQRMPFAMTYNGNKYYLHYDQVGTLKAVSQEDGTIVKTIEYDTFGNVLLDSNLTFKVPFGIAGGLYDTDTKLTRFGYRDYDAYTGKWTAKDPIGFNGGDTNLYGYVLGDPVNFVDPSGLLVPLVIVPYIPLIIKTFTVGGNVAGLVNYGTTTYYNYQLAEAYRSLLIQSNCAGSFDTRDVCVYARKKLLELSHDQTVESIDLCIEGATTR